MKHKSNWFEHFLVSKNVLQKGNGKIRSEYIYFILYATLMKKS